MAAVASRLEKKILVSTGSPVMSDKKIRNLLAKAIKRRYSKVSMWSWHQEEQETDMDKIFVDKLDMSPMDYQSMFIEEHSQNRLRIALTGDAGVGKDTLVRKILTDWSKRLLDHDKCKDDWDYLKRFKMLVPVFCRSLVENVALVDILKDQLDLQHDEAKQVLDFTEKNQGFVLFLIAGYDVVVNEKVPEIADLVNERKLPLVNILVTQRSHSLVRLRKQKFTEIEIHGFTDDGKKDYITRFFKVKDSSADVKNLLTHVTRNEDLCPLSKIPANLLLICCLWQKGEKLPETMTGLYWEFIQYMCGRYEKNFIPRRKRATRGDIVNKYVDQFQELASLARRGLLINDLSATFDLEYAKETLSTVAWRLGILMTTDTKNTGRQVQFIHRTMQEFFIALHVVYDTHGDGMDTLLTICSSKEHFSYSRTVLAFVCGLSAKLSHRLKYVIEREMAKWNDEGSRSNHQYRTDLSIMMFQEAEAQCVLPSIIHLDVTKYEQPLLVRYFALPGQILKDIKLLNINKLGQLELLSNLQHTNLSSLEICGVGETSDTKSVTEYRNVNFCFLAELHPVSVTLTNIFDKHGLLAFFKILLKHRYLESLSVVDCDLAEDGFEILSQTDSSCVQLKELHLTRCHCYSESSTRQLMQSLSKHKQLAVISSEDNRFGISGLSQLRNAFNDISNVRVLQLRSVGCNDKDTWKELLRSLTDMIMLQELDLSNNRFGAEIADTLAQLLSEVGWHKLEKLVLDVCAINNDRTATSVVRSATLYSTVRYISLVANSLGDGMEQISDLGSQLRNIHVMKLASNNISKQVAEVLQSSFRKHCPHARLELDAL